MSVKWNTRQRAWTEPSPAPPQTCHFLFYSRGITPCIPPRAKRKHPATYCKTLYKQRHKVENMFAKLKDWRRIATRYDRFAHTFLSAIKIAAIVIFWINQWVLTLACPMLTMLPARFCLPTISSRRDAKEFRHGGSQVETHSDFKCRARSKSNIVVANWLLGQTGKISRVQSFGVRTKVRSTKRTYQLL